MNEEIKRILCAMMENSEMMETLRHMLVNKDNENKHADSMYVYCVCKHTEDGTAWYHPIVSIKDPNQLFEAGAYHMLASENQFEAYDKFWPQVEMIGNTFDCRLIAISRDKYEAMKASLFALMTEIIRTVESATAICQRLSTLTRSRVPAEEYKRALMIRTLADMETLYDCFNEKYQIVDGSNHIYLEDEESNEYDDEEPEDDCLGRCDECKKCYRCHGDCSACE